MTSPECAEGHEKVPMSKTGKGDWNCPRCSRKIAAGHEKAAPEAPRGLNLEETLWVLRNVPHEPYDRPAEVLEAFERLMERIEEEEEEEDETEAVRDASTNLDKYIYG